MMMFFPISKLTQGGGHLFPFLGQTLQFTTHRIIFCFGNLSLASKGMVFWLQVKKYSSIVVLVKLDMLFYKILSILHYCNTL